MLFPGPNLFSGFPLSLGWSVAVCDRLSFHAMLPTCSFGPMVLTTEQGTVHARLLHPSMPVPMLFYQEDKKEQKISTFDHLSSHLLAGVKGVEPLVNIYSQLRRFSFWLSWTQVITVTYTGLHFICKLIRTTFISTLKPNN